MNYLFVENFSGNGIELIELDVKQTGEIYSEIPVSEFEKKFRDFISNQSKNYMPENRKKEFVLVKQVITKIKHPFQTKTEWDWVEICAPVLGFYKDKVSPRIFRRSVTYVVYAHIYYPIELIKNHNEKCAQQAAVQAAAVAMSGNSQSTIESFRTAFLACSPMAGFPYKERIQFILGGATIYGHWIAV